MKLSTKITDWADKTWLQEEITRYPYGYRVGLALSLTATLVALWMVA